MVGNRSKRNQPRNKTNLSSLKATQSASYLKLILLPPRPPLGKESLVAVLEHHRSRRVLHSGAGHLGQVRRLALLLHEWPVREDPLRAAVGQTVLLAVQVQNQKQNEMMKEKEKQEAKARVDNKQQKATFRRKRTLKCPLARSCI